MIEILIVLFLIVTAVGAAAGGLTGYTGEQK